MRGVTARISIVAIAVATLSAHPGGASAEPPYHDGIDVSHWQNAIDWPSVAGAGVTFAFMKATEGQTFVDDHYELNRAGAAASGIRIGAYHYARPDATPDDAVLEADHFMAIARPRSGDLYPVLDLESSGGLATEALIDWVWAFLDRVHETTGLKVIIYSGPTFWRTHMGDTDEFATGGYPGLWIAHWGVAKPDVPANDWGGWGATFWQYSSCGSVPGITGCVDTDYYKGRSLKKATIP